MIVHIVVNFTCWNFPLAIMQTQPLRQSPIYPADKTLPFAFGYY
jgi:hypothetical protein